jgi:hypothetical protein
MSQPDHKPAQPKRRNRGVLITAWVVGGVAVGIYVVFLLSVMLP